jgi:hypothetical protein
MKVIQKNFPLVSGIRTKLNEQNSPLIKILILSANPKTTSQLRLDEEVREIQEGINRCKNRDQFEIQSRLAVRIRDFRRALLEYEPNIVHFTGHGKQVGIVVEGDLDLPVFFPLKAISGLFKLCSSHVRCVILNACYSEKQANAISRHIDYVIGMKKEIRDKAAIQFTVGFYDALGAGKTIEQAFEFGRNAILEISPEISEYLIPILKLKKTTLKSLDENKTQVNLILSLETTRQVFNIETTLDQNTAIFKSNLLREIKLPQAFSDGYPTVYYLLNKKNGKKLDDSKTLEENQVRENDTLAFFIEVNDE